MAIKILQDNNDEKEVSTGSIIGKALLLMAVLFVIAFIIFAIVTGISKSKASEQTDTTSSIYSVEQDDIWV